MKISSGLIIADPWIGHILNGSKTWEMRSTPTSQRGWIGLIRKGTSEVHGIARIIDCGLALTEAEMLATKDYHCIPEHMISSGQVSKWVIPWKLADVFLLPKPVPYIHRSGAVIWVSFDENVQNSLTPQIPQTESTKGDKLRERNFNFTPKLGSTQVASPTNSVHSKTKHRSPTPKLTFSTEEIIGRSTLTAGNIGNNHFYLTGFLDKFPIDTMGGSNKANKAAKEIIIDWGGPLTVSSDIDKGKRFFRSRGWIRNFFVASNAAEKDTVVVVLVSPYKVHVWVEKWRTGE